ncbi:NTP pyrophosphohydrolase MazG, putative catalytic core [uncultured Caudovirales phage]|uniref:NTP pyrophosphohydrolase MazG, putative catalytic core n=1 Tax=uncultured Caudovirales phage TaxID=2100421 RepID=A0A6J5L6T8_9CAUD|nr:NTP pyrophosphohydrolase MazG, putative catalytic core [uncultured Caudovirales phage]
MNKLQEILIITQEECAEVIQAISKCFRFGDVSNEQVGSLNNRDRVEKEIGDVLAMIDCLVDSGFVDAASLEEAKAAKKEKLRVWSTIFNVGEES